jgi:hypothetical protein
VLFFRSNEFVATTVVPVNAVPRSKAHEITDPTAQAKVALLSEPVLLMDSCAEELPFHANAFVIVVVEALAAVNARGAVIVRVAKVLFPVSETPAPPV